MFFIPWFIKPSKKLVQILRANAGFATKNDIKKLIKTVDVYNEPLPLVFLLACAITRVDKTQMTKQLGGVISHERFGNAMNMSAFQKICKLYNEHNIPVLAQKGLVQKLLYPMSTRPMNDADFAVPKDVYRNAIDLAVENGFHINHDMLFSADLQLRDMGCVDVHYSLFKGANPQMDSLIWLRARKIRTNDMDVMIPSDEDILLIIMCEFYGNFLFEAGSKDTAIRDIFANHPQWVLDTRKIISDNPNLNWGRIMQTAEMSGYGYQIKILTRLLNKILPGTVSTHALKIIDHFCPDYIVRKHLKRDKKIVYLHKINHKFYTLGKY